MMYEDHCEHCSCDCEFCIYIPPPPLQGPHLENGDFIFKKSFMQLIYEPFLIEQLEQQNRFLKLFTEGSDISESNDVTFRFIQSPDRYTGENID